MSEHPDSKTAEDKESRYAETADSGLQAEASPDPASAAGGAVGASSAVKHEAWEWMKALLVALGLVLVIRWLLFAPFIVDGPSMQPNFYTGERLIVNKLIYKIRSPERGEVIVFHAPAGSDYIKRVIALPGEKVKVEGDKVYINGKVLDEPYIRDAVNEAAKKGGTYNIINYSEHQVPEGMLFAMGDNRPQSMDSRSSNVGFVPFNKVVGRADIIFWPFGNIGLIH